METNHSRGGERLRIKQTAGLSTHTNSIPYLDSQKHLLHSDGRAPILILIQDTVTLFRGKGKMQMNGYEKIKQHRSNTTAVCCLVIITLSRQFRMDKRWGGKEEDWTCTWEAKDWWKRRNSIDGGGLCESRISFKGGPISTQTYLRGVIIWEFHQELEHTSIPISTLLYSICK